MSPPPPPRYRPLYLKSKNTSDCKPPPDISPHSNFPCYYDLLKYNPYFVSKRFSIPNHLQRCKSPGVKPTKYSAAFLRIRCRQSHTGADELTAISMLYFVNCLCSSRFPIRLAILKEMLSGC